MDRHVAPADAAQQKADYYRDGFRNMQRIAAVETVVILAMIFFLAFTVITKKDNDRYFAETLEGRKMQMGALSLPNMGNIAITNWVGRAASQIMTFGFNDIDERFALSRSNFTKYGWDSFYKAMIDSKFVEEVLKAQQVITAVPKGVPSLTSEGLVQGKYTWRFNVPLMVTSRAGTAKTSRTKTVSVAVEKVPTQENPNAVGISEWYIY